MGDRSLLKIPRSRLRRASAGDVSSFLSCARSGDPEPSGERPQVRAPWTPKITRTLRPDEPGTKSLAAEFGDRLVCARCRCDPQNRKRHKSVELVVAETAWDPPPGPDDPVHVRVAFGEEELRQRVKAAGGRWRSETKTWELPLRGGGEPRALSESADQRKHKDMANGLWADTLRAVADSCAPGQISQTLSLWDWSRHRSAQLFADATRVVDIVLGMKKQRHKVDLRLTPAAITSALLLTPTAAFIEQYLYGRSRQFARGILLGLEYPVIEFESRANRDADTVEQEILRSTFDVMGQSFSTSAEAYLESNK